jgi:hypothetical protein
MMRHLTVATLLFLMGGVELPAQTRTVGLFLHDTTLAYRGYTLFAPNKYTSTYLIDNNGRLCHQWSRSTYSPGNAVWLLPNGNLLRSCKTQGYFSAGEGGRVEEYTWDDSLVWQFDYSTADYCSHHDIKPLPNGNVLLLAIEKKTVSQALAAGFDSSKFLPEISSLGYMLPDCIIEVQPTRPSGGTIVWEWHVWDHLIQDLDSTRANFGPVAEHPERIDCDGDHQRIKSFWNHMNAIYYNEMYDQILVSVRGNSEVWIVDHSTTTAEAAGHTGGRYGHGGDLLYRWGNPICYSRGSSANQKLYQHHDAEWVESQCPGGGNLMAFNNGIGRNYSSVDEFVPPIDSGGNYFCASDSAFGPAAAAWTYTATPPTSFFSSSISGAQRLANGNTLICGGVNGTFFEVTPGGQLVWKYVNPVINTGPLHFNDTLPPDPTHPGIYQNMVFKIRRFPSTYSAFSGRDLTPGNVLELNTTGVRESAPDRPLAFRLYQNYPNPFNPVTTISYALAADVKVTLRVYNALGQEVTTLVAGEQRAGFNTVQWDASGCASGVYYCRLQAGVHTFIRTLVLLK